MLTANVEATQRPPLPGASQKDQPGGDLFAELLRRLGDSAEPVEPQRPEKPRSAQARGDDEMQRPEEAADATKAPKPSSAPDAQAARAKPAESAEADSTDERASADKAHDATGTRADEGEPASGMPDQVAGTPAPSAPADGTAKAVVPNGIVPPADPLIGSGVPQAAADPAAAMPAAPSIPSSSTEASAAPAQSPVVPVGAPEPASTESAAAAVPTAPVAAPVTGRPPVPQAAAPASASADMPAPAPANAIPPIALAGPAAPAGDGRDVAVQVERHPAATPAQGLGKLGTGAEVALAAQAIGDAQQSAAPGQLRKTAAGAPQQPAPSTSAQSGNAAAAQPASPAAVPAPVVAAAPVITSSMPVESSPAAAGASEDSFEPLGGVGAPGLRLPGTTSAAHAHAAAAPRGTALPSPAEQVAVQIQRAVGDGVSRITVQLKPAELGSIEVQLDLAQDGRVSASILADRPETLDLLQRDARILERSLQDAGLKADSGSLSFDLRGGTRQDQGSPQTAGRSIPERSGSEPHLAIASETTRPATTATAEGGVDIRV
jgi:flagellar hook-length control protein FliK